MYVLLDVIKALEAAGAKAKIDRRMAPARRQDARLIIELDGRRVALDVEERRTPPYPSDVPKLPRASTGRGTRHRAILVAPFISQGVGAALINAGWSWADGAGNFDIKAPGLRLRQRLSLRRPAPEHRVLPGGAGSLVIIRWLLTGAPLAKRLEPSALTALGHVSQPWVSKLLQSLVSLGLLTREGRSYRLDAIEPLLDGFVRDYRGPGGSEQFAYSLEPPNEFAARAAATLKRRLPKGTFAISSDVAPDLVSSWRKPTHTILYVRDSIGLSDLGLVPAKGRGDANVLLRMPEDTSLFSSLEYRSSGSATIPVVDVPQMMWDLLDLGGEDREEAAGRLREWFFQHR